MNKKNQYSLDGITNSSFEKGELIETQVINKGSWRLSGLQNWMTFLGLEQIDKGIGIVEDSTKNEDLFTRKGIAYEFSKLKTDKDIDLFAKKYGLLGIALPTESKDLPDSGFYTDSERMHRVKYRDFFGKSMILHLPYGFSYFEPLEVWKFYIAQIRKILKLYKTLVNIHNGDEKNEIEGNLLNVEKTYGKHEPIYLVEWWDGTQTGIGVAPELAEKGDFLEIARRVLVSIVKNQINRSLKQKATDVIETNKSPLGFIVQEGEITNYLIDAIYNDLWDLISKKEPVYICENPKCRLPFQKVKIQKYCCDACKSDAYRQRKSNAQTMALEGQSIEEIAKFLKVKTESVQKWIKEIKK